jgi:hypothetical protein
MDAWSADGWTMATAKHFLLEGADLHVANQWRSAGQATQRAARLAARGISPEDNSRWLAVGFTAQDAQPWRLAKVAIEPARAKRLAAAGWTPVLWTRLVSRTPVQTVTQAGVVVALTPDLAIEWTEAGVPANELSGWFDMTRGDLDEAVRWSATGIFAHTYGWLQNPVATRYAVMNGSHVPVQVPPPPGWVMPAPDEVQAWLPLNSGQSQELIAAIHSRISPAGYVETLSLFGQGNSLPGSFLVRLRLVLRLQGLSMYEDYWEDY